MSSDEAVQSISLGFPVHSVCEADDRVIIGGGGGEGAHGVPNRIVVLKPNHAEKRLEIDYSLDLPLREVSEGKTEGEEAFRVSAPDPRLVTEVYRTTVAVTLPTRSPTLTSCAPLNVAKTGAWSTRNQRVRHHQP